jgi:hypothetical protein
MDFIGRTTSATALKAQLDGGMQRTRALADQIARGGGAGFALPDGQAAEPLDLEQAMTDLADEQLRFDATARLLQKAYAQVRTAITDRRS